MATSKIPSIPSATDLNSALTAINTMRQAVAILAGNVAGSSTVVPPGAGNVAPPSTAKGVGRFTEVKRTTANVRISNPADSQQYVDVVRITSLTMVDNVTGEQWVWTL